MKKENRQKTNPFNGKGKKGRAKLSSGFQLMATPYSIMLLKAVEIQKRLKSTTGNI
jgi:hypothetical protein